MTGSHPSSLLYVFPLLFHRLASSNADGTLEWIRKWRNQRRRSMYPPLSGALMFSLDSGQPLKHLKNGIAGLIRTGTSEDLRDGGVGLGRRNVPVG